MVEASEIDWAALNEKLPYERNDEAKAKRKDLFQQFDPNANGYLSLAEVRQDKGKAVHRHYGTSIVLCSRTAGSFTAS